MKKSYKIEVDCANCANLMEEAAKKTNGVKDCSVNFMALKMQIEFDEGAEPCKVMKDVPMLLTVQTADYTDSFYLFDVINLLLARSFFQFAEHLSASEIFNKIQHISIK